MMQKEKQNNEETEKNTKIDKSLGYIKRKVNIFYSRTKYKKNK